MPVNFQNTKNWLQKIPFSSSNWFEQFLNSSGQNVKTQMTLDFKQQCVMTFYSRKACTCMNELFIWCIHVLSAGYQHALSRPLGSTGLTHLCLSHNSYALNSSVVNNLVQLTNIRGKAVSPNFYHIFCQTGVSQVRHANYFWGAKYQK